MRPPSPVGGRSRLRACLRNGAYGLGAFSLLTLLRASVLLSGSDDDNPRFRRNIEKGEQAQKQFDEGPIVDLGPGPPASWGSDLFISVKTTEKYHDSRLPDILDTWFRLAPDKVWFFTDTDAPALREATGGHLVNTNCSTGHKRQALCCKMGKEFDFFLLSGKRWMCHFDDDNYVNVPELERLLSIYDPREELYLGRPSTRDRIQIVDRDNMPNKVSFWFATGGAGFCISKALALKMAPHASDGRFVELGERIRLPDDVTMGYLIDHMLGRELTVVDKFHSHLETMSILPADKLYQQVSLSAGSYSGAPNVVSVPDRFQGDERRFRSLHCFLFPDAGICAL